jgi:hypothetical protein
MRVLLASSSTRRILSISGCVLIFLGLLFPAYFSLMFPGSATVYLSNILLKSITLLLQESLITLSALVIFGVALGRLPPAWYGTISAILLLCFPCACVTLPPVIRIAWPLALIVVSALIIIGIVRALPVRARAWLRLMVPLIGLATLWFAPTMPWQSDPDFTPGLSATIFDTLGVAGMLCLLGFLLALVSATIALWSKAEDTDSVPA